ncbi:hypothetical protein [Comamonas terrae]|uniref:Uncharacterized protein n=1 Tax=Comamonas terrae TaxID=673548 RepID=A0ABW5UNI7_9BURK|nr:hypothetical protein [Comamonas terrae]
MQTTMELLQRALDKDSAGGWAKRLNLSRNALNSAKQRGNLSPSIAGALAEELGEDAQKWMVIAALEGERESACKSRMVRKFLIGTALAAGAIGTAAAQGGLYIMFNNCRS